MLNLWASVRGASPRNTLRFWEQVEIVTADRFAGPYGILCTGESPLRPYLERLGAQKVGTADVYLMQPKGF